MSSESVQEVINALCTCISTDANNLAGIAESSSAVHDIMEMETCTRSILSKLNAIKEILEV